MSISITVGNVPESERTAFKIKLGRELYVKPVQASSVRMQQYSNNNDMYVCREEGDNLLLPFFYGLSLKGDTAPDMKTYDKVDIKFEGELWDHQKVYANRAIDMLNRNRVAPIVIRPAFGKTTIATALICRIGLLATVLVHDTNQIKQWGNTFRERSSALPWLVGVDKTPPVGFNVIVCLYTRSKKIPLEIRKRVGVLVVDEVHQYCNKTGVNSMLDFPEPAFLLTFTATYHKANGMHRVIDLFNGENLIEGPKSIPSTVFHCPLPFTARREKSSSGNIDWTLLCQSLFYNQQRNETIVKLVASLINESRKILLFSNEVKHVTTLCDMLTAAGIESCDYLSGSKSSYKDSAVLVGNLKKCGTGFDEQMFCEDFSGARIDTVILCVSIKDSSLLHQVIGRAYRAKDPRIYHLVDDDSIIKRHWNECRKWYKDNQGTVIANHKIEVVQEPSKA